MIFATLPKRGADPWGSGEFGASRGQRTHKGIDFACYPGTIIRSVVKGDVTKLGYPYGDDLSYRYVEVTRVTDGTRHRLFYVEPIPGIEVGDPVRPGDRIGTAQDLFRRYDTRMRNHVHYEILDEDGEALNPEEYHGRSS